MLTSVLKHESCYMGLDSVVNSSVYNSASISFPEIRTDLNNWTAAIIFCRTENPDICLAEYVKNVLLQLAYELLNLEPASPSCSNNLSKML